MRRIIDNLTEPAEHLALDEALLLEADAGVGSEAIRLWEFAEPVVVAGRATRVHDEIDVEYCHAHRIPILRRCSGGAAVVGGPGCLMYSIVLSLDSATGLRKIDVAHQHVIGRVLEALRRQIPEAEFQGTCDLTWLNRKCSGNSLRIARHHLLYHGTILHDFDLALLSAALKEAPRQPEYRSGRDHDSFVTNVSIDPESFTNDLCEVFQVTGTDEHAPLLGRIRQLRQQRYDVKQWHFRH